MRALLLIVLSLCFLQSVAPPRHQRQNKKANKKSGWPSGVSAFVKKPYVEGINKIPDEFVLKHKIKENNSQTYLDLIGKIRAKFDTETYKDIRFGEKFDWHYALLIEIKWENEEDVPLPYSLIIEMEIGNLYLRGFDLFCPNNKDYRLRFTVDNAEEQKMVNEYNNPILVKNLRAWKRDDEEKKESVKRDRRRNIHEEKKENVRNIREFVFLRSELTYIFPINLKKFSNLEGYCGLAEKGNSYKFKEMAFSLAVTISEAARFSPVAKVITDIAWKKDLEINNQKPMIKIGEQQESLKKLIQNWRKYDSLKLKEDKREILPTNKSN